MSFEKEEDWITGGSDRREGALCSACSDTGISPCDKKIKIKSADFHSNQLDAQSRIPGDGCVVVTSLWELKKTVTRRELEIWPKFCMVKITKADDILRTPPFLPLQALVHYPFSASLLLEYYKSKYKSCLVRNWPEFSSHSEWLIRLEP